MLQMPESDVDIRERSPLELAFLGDGVFSLLARAQLVAKGRAQAGALHEETARIVSAAAQADALARLAAHLTDEEQALVRRAQNAAPKPQSTRAWPNASTSSTATRTAACPPTNARCIAA